jgi:drug/metabolite transporter (DMT)-like permease
MARVGPTVASILLTAEVPLAVSWSILFLGEQLQPMQVVGGALDATVRCAGRRRRAARARP